jgi:hypothetical protein
MRADRVRRIADEIEALGVPMLLVSDSAQAAEHAALRLGLIDDRDLAQVSGAVTRHRRAPFSR